MSSRDSCQQPIVLIQFGNEIRRGKPRLWPTRPRERIVAWSQDHCHDSGAALRLIDEDVIEILDFIVAKLKLVETARLKKSCRSYEKIVQSAAPTRPIR